LKKYAPFLVLFLLVLSSAACADWASFQEEKVSGIIISAETVDENHQNVIFHRFDGQDENYGQYEEVVEIEVRIDPSTPLQEGDDVSLSCYTEIWGGENRINTDKSCAFASFN
jgi:hypothetical protein